jgi:recombinational DNA repair protein (RecF pathway)
MPEKIRPSEALQIMKRAGLKPLEPYKNSKHPWKSIHIKCGRTVTPTYNGIQRGQGGCAYCAGLKIDPREARELFLSKNLKPLVPYPGGNKIPWKSIHTLCGNEVAPTFNVISRGESMGCHFCSDQFVDPQEAYQFFISKDLQPLVPYPGSAKPWKSIHLICGSEINPRYGHIKSGRTGCPVCAGVVPITQTRAVAFFRERGLEPKGKFPGPNKPWKSIHKSCGREVSPRWASVQQGQGVCKYCSKRVVDKKQISKLLESLQLKPLVPYPGTGLPWRMIHLPCGNEVSPRYNGISRGQGACIHCAGMVIDKNAAKKLFENAGLKPQIAFPGTGKPWKSIHIKCGNQVSPTYNFIKSGGKGCVYCAGHAPITERQALKLFRAHGFTPLVKFQGAKKAWKSTHNVCGKTVAPTYGSIRRGGGCKYCQIGGINLLAPGFFYLMTNEALGSHKVGIGGFLTVTNRLDQHKRHGWSLYKQVKFESAEKAYELEQQVLDWIRLEIGLPQYLLPSQMPQGGHTETIDASEIDLPKLWKKILEFKNLIKN